MIHISKKDPYNPPVIIFVHSQGAIIANLALDLLNESDRKRIRIFAFGGGSLIAPGKSHDKTHNYLSEADIIPRIGSIQLAQLIIRRYEKQKQGLSEEEIIDCLISADADYYLETTESKALAAFYRERKKFYHEEFGKISNLSVLEQSEDSGYWEHSFAVPCYQRKLQEIIQQYRHTSCEISLQVLALYLIKLLCAFYHIFLSESKKNLEADPLVKKWIGKEFEIKKGVYILKYKDDRSARYHLTLLDNDTHFLQPVEEFLQNPKAWFSCGQSWYRPVIPGAHFRILKIYKHIKPAVGEFLIIEAIMLDGDYENVKVEINDLFNYDLWSFQIFRSKEEFIQALN